MKQTQSKMTNEKILLEIRAKFIIESMSNGLSFELALEKSFNQINEFCLKLKDDVFFNEYVFLKATKQTQLN